MDVLCSVEEVSRNNQDKRRDIKMKMRILVTIENEDESELTEPTTIEVNIPEFEAFTGPEVFGEVFDQYEREVLKARNGVVEEAIGKYLSAVAKKTQSEFEVLAWLWLGKVDRALKVLSDLKEDTIKNTNERDNLSKYLQRNQDCIPCYALHKKLGLRISSNPVEKANDVIVSHR